jgi:transcriptional regulator with XRE-family HTH domain
LSGFFIFSPTKLRGTREARGWSQYKLSYASSVPQPHIWAYEAGKRSPSRPTIVRLAEALKVSPRDLVDEDPMFAAVAK